MGIGDWGSVLSPLDLVPPRRSTRARSSRCRCRSRTRRRKPEPGPARRSRWAIAPASLLHCPRRSHRLLHLAEQPGDRKSVVSGKSVSVRVDLGGRRIIKTKKKTRDRKKTHNMRESESNDQAYSKQ